MPLLKGRVGGAVGGFTSYLTSPEALAAVGAMVFTPLITNYIVPLVTRLPVLGSQPAIALVVGAIVVFIIARYIGGGIVRSLLLGVSAGMVINAVLATGVGRGIVTRLGGALGGR